MFSLWVVFSKVSGDICVVDGIGIEELWSNHRNYMKSYGWLVAYLGKVVIGHWYFLFGGICSDN